MSSSNAEHILENFICAVVLLDEEGTLGYINNTAKQLLSEIEIGAFPSNLIKETFPEVVYNETSTGWSKFKEFFLKQTKLVGSANTISIEKNNWIILCFHKLSELDLACLEGYTETKRMLDESFDEIIIMNSKGTVLNVSKASCERLYGVKPDKIIGHNVKDLETMGYYYPSKFQEIIQNKVRQTFLQTNKMGQKTIVTVNPVVNHNGEVIYVVANSRDITELLNVREQYQDYELDNYFKGLIKTKLDNPLSHIVVESPAMCGVMQMAKRIAKYDCNVLLLGESGVGKGLVAKFIHKSSARSEKPFVKINCGAIPANLIESELFGYKGGAFTGALKDGKKGLIEEAEGGTVFLDEIAELPFHLQSKLLNFIEERRIINVGASKSKVVDTRIIAATNSNLPNMIGSGDFRRDLFYRLNVVSIFIPPLRERIEDIVKLCRYYLEHFNEKYDDERTMSPRALDVILAHTWPGNIRELENFFERFYVICNNNVLSSDLVTSIIESGLANDYLNFKSISVFSDEKNSVPDKQASLNDITERAEKKVLEEAYIQLKSIRLVAIDFGVSYSTAFRRLKKYNIT